MSAGLILGILASRVVATIVYQAALRDPPELVGLVLARSFLGQLAVWIPAQRTPFVDPLIFMREE